MITHAGVLSDHLGDKLPADAGHALFAYSLVRKLRYLYSGQWFRYRQGGSYYDYPASAIDPNQPAYLAKLYDQKARYGHTVYDIEQTTEANQPELIEEYGVLRARFTGSQYLRLDEDFDPWESGGEDMTLTLVAKRGGAPAPAITLRSATTGFMSIEPGTSNARFVFIDETATGTDNQGSCHHGVSVVTDTDIPELTTEDGISLEMQGGGNLTFEAWDIVLRCFSGISEKQDSDRVLSITTGRGDESHTTRTQSTPDWTFMEIGRESLGYAQIATELGDGLLQEDGDLIAQEDEHRHYSGDISEVYVHLGSLTDRASSLSLTSTQEIYN